MKLPASMVVAIQAAQEMLKANGLQWRMDTAVNAAKGARSVYRCVEFATTDVNGDMVTVYLRNRRRKSKMCWVATSGELHIDSPFEIKLYQFRWDENTTRIVGLVPYPTPHNTMTLPEEWEKWGCKVYNDLRETE